MEPARRSNLDLSTGDAITPEAILTQLDVMFADPIPMLVYSTETVIAEKLQTVIARTTFNTRMRDFYDLHALYRVLGSQIDTTKLKAAVAGTFERRQTTEQLSNWEQNINSLESNEHMANQWQTYARRYDWANHLTWEDVITAVRQLFESSTAQISR